MTPEDKSKELIEKFKPFVNQMCPIHDGNMPYENPEWDEKNNAQMERLAKACAIIAVDEIIEALSAFGYSGALYDDFETGQLRNTDKKDPAEYWTEVKQLLSKES